MNHQDFHTAYNALRTQAEVHGLNTLDQNMNTFLVHMAEVMAQDRANEREAYRVAHAELTDD